MDELLLMDDPTNDTNRIKHWKILFDQLILLNRVDNYVISHDGLNVNFDINQFTYFLKFNDDDFKVHIRNQVIDQLIDPE